MRTRKLAVKLGLWVTTFAMVATSLTIVEPSAGSATLLPQGTGGGVVPTPAVDTAHGTVCLFWPNQTEPGWVPFAQTGIAAFHKYMPNFKQLTYDGDNSAATQLSQVQACIASKANLAIISPPVPTDAGAALKDLAAAHIPTIAQDNDPDGGPVYAYVWVNFEQVGAYFGKFMVANIAKQITHRPIRLAEMYGDPTFAVYFDWLTGITPYLNSLIKSGLVKVVCKSNTPGWDPTTAQTNLEQCLTKTGNGIDAILGMNDSTMDGMAAALETQHLLGKVKMYGGHDSDLTTLQRILAGDQYATFHPDNHSSFEVTVELAEAALAGKSAESTGLITFHFNNGFVKGGVPTVKAPELLVTAANMAQSVVGEGLYTKAELCTSIALTSAFCKG
jgi:D-xylose transport system substrate-binding protein